MARTKTPTRWIDQCHLWIRATDGKGEFQKFRVDVQCVDLFVAFDLVDHQQIDFSRLNRVLHEIKNLVGQ